MTPGPDPASGLTIIGSYMLPEQTIGEARDVIAELSGAWYDADTKQLLLVSDRRDRSAIFTMDVEVSPEVRLVPKTLTMVEPAVPQRTLDLEGIARAPNGHLFLSSEGEPVNPDEAAPGIYEYTRAGRFVSRLDLPAAYAGLQSNAGLEGLSASPSGRRLFAAAEASLRQDGAVASFEAGSLTRLLAYELGSRDRPREYAYRTEAVPRLPGGVPAIGTNGVSEILAVGEDDLLVLERAFVEGRGPGAPSANTIRIFHVRLTRDADVSGRWSLLTEPPGAVLSKTLLLDLDTIVPKLVERLGRLENFEAMTFGPDLPDGRRTLVLISDNNLRETQVSALIVLAFGS
jgi:hypothetical protein